MNVLDRLRARGLGLVLAVTIAGFGGSGCARTHLTASHGRAFHEAFAIQDANPNRSGNPKSVNGLDSQEASIIAGSYRRALAPKAEAANNGQLLMMSPNQGGGLAAGAMAPSVPQGN
jgi:hypothetical protein